MIIELDWLKKYVNFDLSIEKLGHLLSMSGLEVEAVERVELPDGRRKEVMELNVTPNRGYCLSYIGVAREVAGLLDRPLLLPDTTLPKAEGSSLIELLEVSNVTPDLCGRYSVVVIEDVQLGPSPEWLQSNLRVMGLRPINNIVDISNFVLMEYGQPLHAFDYDRLQGGIIQVRRAITGERFASLTGKELTLDQETLVIADSEKPVALAGVVGGANSEVTETTRRVALESACFDPISVRKTSKKYLVRTDSSFRFERGVDIEAVAMAQDRAARLIVEITGGKLCRGRIDLYPKKYEPINVVLRLSRVQLMLGKEISGETVYNSLSRLGLKMKASREGFDVKIPSFRPNLKREVDIIEELARVEGFGKFEPTSPVGRIYSVPPSANRKVIKDARKALCILGYSETLNYSFINKTEAEAFLKVCVPKKEGRCISLNNPLSEGMGTMRTSLLPGLLKTALRNVRQGQKSVKLFELGKVYYYESSDEGSRERFCIAALLHGVHENTPWKVQGKNYDFYDLKGAVESLGAQFKLPLTFLPTEHFLLAQGRGMKCAVGDFCLGFLGELSVEIRERFGLETPVYVMELNFDALLEQFKDTVRFSPIAKFPETYRDLSVLVDKATLSGTLEKLVRDIGGPILNKVELYDCFEGKKLPYGKKSLTFALSFQSSEKTLTDVEVNLVFEKIVQALKDRLGATLRDA